MSECLVNVLSGSHAISAPLALAALGNLVNVTNAADSLTISGGVSGVGGLTKTGPGTLVLTGSNTYSGATTVAGGLLALSNTGAVPPGTGNIAINFGGVLAGGYGTISGWLSSNKIVGSSAGVLALTGTDTGTVSMASFPSLVVGAAGAATFSGSFTPAGSAYCLGGGGGALTFSTALTGGNSLVAFGGGSGGTLILSGSN